MFVGWRIASLQFIHLRQSSLRWFLSTFVASFGAHRIAGKVGARRSPVPAASTENPTTFAQKQAVRPSAPRKRFSPFARMILSTPKGRVGDVCDLIVGGTPSFGLRTEGSPGLRFSGTL